MKWIDVGIPGATNRSGCLLGALEIMHLIQAIHRIGFIDGKSAQIPAHRKNRSRQRSSMSLISWWAV